VIQWPMKHSICSLTLCLLLIALPGCGRSQDARRAAAETSPAELTAIGSLSIPISNNAVALSVTDQDTRIYSFFGLESGKTWQDVSNRSQLWQQTQDGTTYKARLLPSPPGASGRLASTAQQVGTTIYLFGGYTVAEDHTEVSTPEVYAFDVISEQYQHVTDMPVPVDDAVSMVYQNRYIILVSGWHQDRNVEHVQILDTQTMSWLSGTPFPGEPLFGHSGGLIDETMVICDGVRIVPLDEPGKREFRITDACFIGSIDPLDLTRIDWQAIPPHPGTPLYRSASAGLRWQDDPLIVFAGGSSNPYNYNGIGYNDIPSSPSDRVFSFNVQQSTWQVHRPLAVPSMDHRGLLYDGQWLYLAGGMHAGQRTTGDIVQFTLSDPTR